MKIALLVTCVFLIAPAHDLHAQAADTSRKPSIGVAEPPPPSAESTAFRSTAMTQSQPSSSDGSKQVDAALGYLQDQTQGQLIGSEKKGIGELAQASGKTGAAVIMEKFPLNPVDAWLSGSSLLASGANTLLPSEFLTVTTEVLASPVTGAFVGEVLRSEPTAPPRLDQVGAAAGLSWQQYDQMQAQALVAQAAKQQQEARDRAKGLVHSVPTTSQQPATLVNPPLNRPASPPAASSGSKNCAGGIGFTAVCK